MSNFTNFDWKLTSILLSCDLCSHDSKYSYLSQNIRVTISKTGHCPACPFCIGIISAILSLLGNSVPFCYNMKATRGYLAIQAAACQESGDLVALLTNSKQQFPALLQAVHKDLSAKLRVKRCSLNIHDCMLYACLQSYYNSQKKNLINYVVSSLEHAHTDNLLRVCFSYLQAGNLTFTFG